MTQGLRNLTTAAALVAAIFISHARAGTPEEEIRTAIAQLGTEDLKEREAAEALLREIGPEAALLYLPDDASLDPECHYRMERLLESWQFLPASAMKGTPRPCRLNPWEQVADAPRDWWSELDDDRVPAARASAGDLLTPLAEESRPLHPAIVRAALATDPQGTVLALSTRRALPMPPDLAEEVHAAALRIAEDPGCDAAVVVLFTLGNRTAGLAAIRARRARGESRILERLTSDREVCETLAEAWKDDGPISEVLRWRFPDARFVEAYVNAGEADLAAALPDRDAIPALLKLVRSEQPSVRFRAACRLGARGLRTDPLKDFTGMVLDDAFVAAAPLLDGQGVWSRLRLAATSSDSTDGTRAAALRALAARGSARDITYIYEQMKTLPPSAQPAVAVSLSRLGSAAGIGLLVPRLTGLDFELRRDANTALIAISGVDLGYDPAGTLPDRCRAARRWARWWEENRRSFSPK